MPHGMAPWAPLRMAGDSHPMTDLASGPITLGMVATKTLAHRDTIRVVRCLSNSPCSILQRDQTHRSGCDYMGNPIRVEQRWILHQAE